VEKGATRGSWNCSRIKRLRTVSPGNEAKIFWAFRETHTPEKGVSTGGSCQFYLEYFPDQETAWDSEKVDGRVEIREEGKVGCCAGM